MPALQFGGGGAWDLGDGGSSTDQDPIHTEGQPGSYTVTLTVASDAGFEDTLVGPDYISVTAPDAPVAHFSADPRSGRVRDDHLFYLSGPAPN